MKRQTRSEARCAAFTQVFQMKQHREEMDAIMQYMLEEKPECNDNLGYITAVVNGVKEHEQEIEDIISAHLKKGWTLSRISKVAAAVMKVAVYEMKYVDDVPPKVAINEAVELVKKYGAEEDPAFVNGVLGSVMKEL
jgi:N utilization substance protein B